MADELRSLGLPRRAILSSSAGQMRASFDAAVVVVPDCRLTAIPRRQAINGRTAILIDRDAPRP
jgi:hypothetical protein